MYLWISFKLYIKIDRYVSLFGTLTTFASSAKCVKSAKPVEVCISKLACAVILIEVGGFIYNIL